MSKDLLRRAVHECATSYRELRVFLAMTVPETLANPAEYYRLSKIYKRRTRQWNKFYQRWKAVVK